MKSLTDLQDTEKIKCTECKQEILKKDSVFDYSADEYICEDHLGENTTGYCSVSCRRGRGCDDSC